MHVRFSPWALLLLAVPLTIAGCTNSAEVSSIAISPATQTATVGEPVNFTAIGTYNHQAPHPPTQQDVTDSATWTSSNPAVAKVIAPGQVTAVSAGTATITASMNGFTGLVSATAALTVTTATGTGTGPGNSDVISVTVIPGAQTVTSLLDTAAYAATGTTASGAVVNLTTAVKWSSSSAQIATINTSGVAMPVGPGTTTITAQYTNPDNTVATGTATLTITGGGGGANSDITSITVLPGSQAVAEPGGMANFVAVGTTSAGGTVSMQGLAIWSSSSTQIATIDGSTGVATGEAQGTVTITAQYTNADKTIATGTATFTVQGAANEQFTAVTIVPATETLSSGGKANLTALATLGSNGLQEDVTNSPSVTWTSSIPTYVSVTSGQSTGNGVVMGEGVGPSTIVVKLQNADGTIVSNTATVTGSATPAPEPILSLQIIPSTISVNDFQLTGQFLAIGTFATPPYVRDLTNDPCTNWISTSPEMFPVSTSSAAGSNSTGANCGSATPGANLGASGGIVTPYASGGAVIVAEAASPDGTIQTATATFNCPYVAPPGTPSTPPSCYPGQPPPQTLLSTLTIYNEGLNTTNWEITAASATGTPNVLHCGPGWTAGGGAGGSVCTATYPANTVTPAGTPGVLVEAQQVGGGQGTFGGSSDSCTPSNSQGTPIPAPGPYWTATGPNYCVAPLNVTGIFLDSNGNPVTVTVPNTNVTVGVIFN